MTSPNPRPNMRPNMMYDWKGFPSPAKGWRYAKETMAQLDEEGRIWYPTFKDGTHNTSRRPQLKRYLDEMKGGVMGNVWPDISPINSQAKERIGYPTQKPLALLDRIIKASSNEGDMVLDPFAGCATACTPWSIRKGNGLGLTCRHWLRSWSMRACGKTWAFSSIFPIAPTSHIVRTSATFPITAPTSTPSTAGRKACARVAG